MIGSSRVKAFLKRQSSADNATDGNFGTTKKTVESSATSNNNDFVVIDKENSNGGGGAADNNIQSNDDELFLRLRSEAVQVVE